MRSLRSSRRLSARVSVRLALARCCSSRRRSASSSGWTLALSSEAANANSQGADICNAEGRFGRTSGIRARRMCLTKLSMTACCCSLMRIMIISSSMMSLVSFKSSPSGFMLSKWLWSESSNGLVP